MTRIGEWAFSGCSNLTSVTIGNSVTKIGHQAFYECRALKKVIAEDIAAWCNISFSDIDSNPLSYARHLYSDGNTEIKELIIPNSVMSIGNYVFSGCSNLTSVFIPNSVTSIGINAFLGCIELKDVYCYADKVPSASIDAFKDSKIEHATLHVPAASIDVYKAEPWSGFKEIVALERWRYLRYRKR